MSIAEGLAGKLLEQGIKKVVEEVEKKAVDEIKELGNIDTETLHKKMEDITSKTAGQLEEYANSILEQAKQQEIVKAIEETADTEAPSC